MVRIMKKYEYNTDYSIKFVSYFAAYLTSKIRCFTIHRLLPSSVNNCLWLFQLETSFS